MTANPRPARRWGVLAISALLIATLLVGVYLLATLTVRLAVAWANRPGPQPQATSSVATPLPTRVRVGAATATRIPGRTPVPTATSAPTATPATPGVCSEGLRDGGFELGTEWNIVNTAYTAGYVSKPAAYVTNPVHSGQRALRLGISEGPDIFSYSAAEQTVVVPADATSVRLSVWMYLKSDDRGGDGQYLLVLKEGGGYDTLMWELSNNAAWQRREYSLSAYRGQRVTIHFEAHNDGDGALTVMYVDDVSLTICRTPPAPSPSPRPR